VLVDPCFATELLGIAGVSIGDRHISPSISYMCKIAVPLRQLGGRLPCWTLQQLVSRISLMCSTRTLVGALRAPSEYSRAAHGHCRA
jgi:hypothetical protein